MAVCVLLLLVGCLVAGWFGVQLFIPEHLPTPTQTQPPGEEWQRIQSKGIMVVGVDLGNPPLAFANEQLVADGFDPALMQAIANQLGVQVTFVDVAYGGLGNALYLKQLDVAVSGIPPSQEPQPLEDYSQVYYETQDAILRAPASNIGSFINLEQTAAYKMGVQEGTLQYAVALERLVETGRMLAANLVVYPTQEAAISALQTGEVDLIYSDLDTALRLAKDGQAALAGQDLYPQRYVLAVRKGATELVNKINEALDTLESQGKIAELARIYLEDARPPVEKPTKPTPVKRANTTPATGVVTLPACLDSLAVVGDLNLVSPGKPATMKIQPGLLFKKGWRILNTGTCAWTSSYRWQFAYGNTPAARMGGQPTPIIGVVAPGTTYDVFIDMVTPVQPGIYHGFWNLVNTKNIAFGERLWLGLEVDPNFTPTLEPPKVLPTQAPENTPITLPTLPATVQSGGFFDAALTADRMRIHSGEAVTLAWQVIGAKEVYLSVVGQEWRNFRVAAWGARVETPGQTTVYELRSILHDNSIQSRQLRIEVIQPGSTPEPPVIISFSSDFSEVTPGTCILLSWQVGGQTRLVQLYRDGEPVIQNAPLAGQARDCLRREGPVEYVLRVENRPGQMLEAKILVDVVHP